MEICELAEEGKRLDILVVMSKGKGNVKNGFETHGVSKLWRVKNIGENEWNFVIAIEIGVKNTLKKLLENGYRLISIGGIEFM